MTHRFHEPLSDTVVLAPDNARITRWAVRVAPAFADREVQLRVNGNPVARISIPHGTSGEFYADLGDGVLLKDSDTLDVTGNHHLDADCMIEFTMPPESPADSTPKEH